MTDVVSVLKRAKELFVTHPDSEEGHNARVKAFDKLIKYYELDKKNHE